MRRLSTFTGKKGLDQKEIQEMMKLGIFNCEVIYGKLKELGYQGGKTIIKDYVKAFRPPRGIVATCRYETKPGKQVQVDWGTAHTLSSHISICSGTFFERQEK